MGFLISISHARGQRELFDLVLQCVDPALNPSRPGADQGGIKVAAYSYHSSDFGHDPGPLAPSSITSCMGHVECRSALEGLQSSPVQVQARQTAGQEYSTVQ
jgi:hypothetical protein